MRRRHSILTFAGSIHFITTVTAIRGHWFSSDAICTTILELFEGYRQEFGLECYGYVLMPDHLHALLLQPTDGEIVIRMMTEFKKWSSRRHLIPGLVKKGMWMRSYDDVPVPGANAARVKAEYIHNNPVRRGLVVRAEDYPWSSARDYANMVRGVVTVTLL